MSPAGELESVSPQLTKYFGKTLEQLRHWASDDTVHPEDRPRVNEVFAQAIARGEPYRFEARFRRADGVYQWFQCRGRPSRDETGRIIRWYCVGIDIDERKRAEEALRTEIAERQRAEVALRESERDLRSVVDGIPGFVAILAPNGYIETVNRRILEYGGFSLEELRKWATNGTIHHEDVPHVAETLNKSIASGVPYEIEHRMRRHDGAYLWFNNRGIPARNDAGQIVRWYVLLTDIEEQKRPRHGAPVKSSFSTWSQAAVRCRISWRRFAGLSKAWRADVTAASCCSIRAARSSRKRSRRVFRPNSTRRCAAGRWIAWAARAQWPRETRHR